MEKMNVGENMAGSFRDPDGFVFFENGVCYRQINQSYKNDYEQLTNSGLYDELVENRLLIPHKETGFDLAKTAGAFRIILPEIVPFVSYSYEWCFSQLRDAALLTLEIQKRAFDHGMSLKDASGFNIQFYKGRPIFIDTLSFEIYKEGTPWQAYKQFCQHFLAPLALMKYKDVRLGQLLKIYIDGVPLDLASEILPLRTRFNFGLLSNIHVHARFQKKYEDKKIDKSKMTVSDLSYRGLLDTLESAIRKLKPEPAQTEWRDYYEKTSNYSAAGVESKTAIIEEFLDRIGPKNVWDFGSNTGYFSRMASRKNIFTVSFDMDPSCVEINYRNALEEKETRILPLILDLTNPTPPIGWANRERMSMIERSPADMIMALALIHHLAISNNLPLDYVARFFGELCDSLIIEFVPKSDSQVQKLLASREDIFPEYTREGFEKAFFRYFKVIDSKCVSDSSRIVYLMKKA